MERVKAWVGVENPLGRDNGISGSTVEEHRDVNDVSVGVGDEEVTHLRAAGRAG